MELTHLRYFTAVAEELHFGRAAERLGMAQPPLSQRIKLLEEELGAALFKRSSRRVELTDAGRLFLKEAREILEKADGAAARVAELGTGQAGSLVVGFNEPAINTFLPAAIKAFRKKWPRVALSLREMETTEQLDALRAGRIDLGFMRPFGHDLDGLGESLVFSERYLVALPRGHRLAGTGRLPLGDLRGEEFVMFPRSVQPVLRDRLLECCEAAGFTPRIAQEAIGKQTTLALVEAGIGVALVPESTSRRAPLGVTFLHVDGDLPPVDIHAAWRLDGPIGAVKNFLCSSRWKARGLP